MNPIIELKNVSGRKIKNLSLEIFPSEIIVILGPSGSGKTTLLRFINLLVDIEEGTILYDGKPVKEFYYPSLRRKAILLPQMPVTVEGTVYENMEWANSFGAPVENGSVRDFGSCLDVVGISKLKNNPAEQISVGEKQRLNLAMGFSLNPDMMLLDEPTSALDPETAGSIHAAIKRLNSKGVSFVIASHNLSEAIKLAHKVGIMIDGQMKQFGLIDDILANPVDAEVARFLEFHKKNNA